MEELKNTLNVAMNIQENSQNIFSKLSMVDCSNQIEKKGNLSYLSWAWAIGIFQKVAGDFSYDIRHWDGKPYLYDPNLGYMVETSVTCQGVTKSMWLPVMDYKNKAMMADTATMMDINKTIMRCLVKNLAMFGLGHSIYAGEDLPSEELYKVKMKDTKSMVFDYLINNNKALEYYCSKYSAGHIEDFTQSQIDEIYLDLKKYNKI
ncbi:DUF1071 domain-containing protein [Methanobrevibacter sp.]|uniref:Sak single strand annealing protein n=1 Tax=Methanobrevibacter sp. TaxID=66852 RepID=UPI00388FE940